MRRLRRALGAGVALLTLALIALAVFAEPSVDAAAGDTYNAALAAAPPRHSDRVLEGPSVEQRLAEIQQRVQAVASYPETARLRGVSGEVQVAFEIEPDGRAVNVHVARSSGSLALDHAAERAVHEAGALPRVIGRVHVPVRFALVAAH